MALALISKKIGGLAAPLAHNLDSAYIDALRDVMASSTAEAIQGFLRSSKVIVGILLIDTSAATDSMHIAPSVLSGDNETKKFTGGVAVLNVDSPLNLKGKKIPIGVSLMHELGHAKQYIEKPEWYETLFAEILRLGNMSQSTATAESKADSHPSVTGLKKFSEKGQAKKLIVDQYLKGPRRTLENDNLARHEIPILKALGLPHRDDYYDS